MSGFMESLEARCEKDTRLRAVLRRSLSFAPGTMAESFPYVEPFAKDDDEWRRSMRYLTAGLWALNWRAGRNEAPIGFAEACGRRIAKADSGNDPSKVSSTERRFISLLDADEEQLPERLRHMTSLLAEYRIDFEAMLKGLVFWRNEARVTQNQWARAFYKGSKAIDYSHIEEEEQV